MEIGTASNLSPRKQIIAVNELVSVIKESALERSLDILSMAAEPAMNLQLKSVQNVTGREAD